MPKLRNPFSPLVDPIPPIPDRSEVKLGMMPLTPGSLGIPQTGKFLDLWEQVQGNPMMQMLRKYLPLIPVKK
jgi:hypothetical protein